MDTWGGQGVHKLKFVFGNQGWIYDFFEGGGADFQKISNILLLFLVRPILFSELSEITTKTLF